MFINFNIMYMVLLFCAIGSIMRWARHSGAGHLCPLEKSVCPRCYYYVPMCPRRAKIEVSAQLVAGTRAQAWAVECTLSCSRGSK